VLCNHFVAENFGFGNGWEAMGTVDRVNVCARVWATPPLPHGLRHEKNSKVLRPLPYQGGCRSKKRFLPLLIANKPRTGGLRAQGGAGKWSTKQKPPISGVLKLL